MAKIKQIKLDPITVTALCVLAFTIGPLVAGIV